MFKTLRNTITSIKAAFWLFIETVQTNTIQLQALAAEQRLLRAKLDTLVDHSAFQVRVKKAELNRAGHRVD
jgi:hypothetical protein